IVTIAEMGLSALLGSARLGRRGFLYDESVAATISSGSLAGLYKAVRVAEPNMAGYLFLLHIWQSIFGQSEVALRSLSVVGIAAAVPVVVAIGRRIFGLQAGLLAGFLFALSPFVVQMAQFTRSYGVLVLLVSLSTLFLLRALDNGRRIDWVFYVLI